MDIIELVKEQIGESHKKVRSLVQRVDFKDWYEIPEGINTNIAWQVGHLIISKYFQLVVAPMGSTREIYEIMPFKEYLALYGIGTKATSKVANCPEPEYLLTKYDEVQQFVIRKIGEFDVSTINEPTVVPHPLAKTRYEALMWSFQHEIWHCGQIAMIRRAMGNPKTFG